MTFEIEPNGWKGDGSRFQTFVFKNIGEIDFIAAPTLTENPTIVTEVEGFPTPLETVPEIITKKIFFRRGNIKPRDIFDVAVAGNAYRRDVVAELTRYPEQVRSALTQLKKLNPEFVQMGISNLELLEPFKKLAHSSREDAQEILEQAISRT